MARPRHRLPETVRPQRYEPHLEVGLDEETFTGHVGIDLVIDEATDVVELHASQLEATEVTLETDGTRLEPTLEEDPKRDRWILTLPETIGPGKARLEITYEGRVGRDMTGLYRSEAGDDVCLVTQCEPTDARSVFPCFDEPAFKAEIAWSIRADDGLQVLANGQLADVEAHDDGTATRTFDPTPPIASYLAAVAVGDFEHTDSVEARGIPFRVWALNDAELGHHARDQAGRLLAWFEDYFETPYPYAKYDQIAVPSFSFGAMENVGLVVFREPLLLLDPARATWDEEKAVDRVVAHEFAHMWFGNLVTMEWWDDLWLNEAFAEWIAHEAVDALEPDHQIWEAFRARTDQALATDALENTHAIYHPVETPAEAMEMFDAITYGKGSAVMRMLAGYLGKQAFQSGLASYIDAFREDNAAGQDLWDHLARASDQPVGDVMEAWIEQPGHPCVDVSLVDETDGSVTAELSQHRHLARREADARDARWPVPVVLRYADDAGVHESRHLLTEATARVDLGTQGSLAWLVGNADQGGFYRVDHDDALTERLVDHARELAPAELSGLLRDSFSLVKAGRRDVEDHLALLDELATGQGHFSFVDDVVSHTRQLERLIEDRDEQAWRGLQRWTADTFGPALEELGAEPRPGEDPARRHRRSSVLIAMGQIAADEAAVTAASKVAERERANPDDVDPETATAAVRVAARHGDTDRFETFADTYLSRREADRPPQQVERYLQSLPLFRDDASVDQLLELIDDGTIPNQSIGPLLERMLREPHTQRAALGYVQANLQPLLDLTGHAWIARIVEAIGHAGPGLADEARQLLTGSVAELAPETTKRALERLEQARELDEAGVVDAVADWARAHAD